MPPPAEAALCGTAYMTQERGLGAEDERLGLSGADNQRTGRQPGAGCGEQEPFTRLQRLDLMA